MSTGIKYTVLLGVLVSAGCVEERATQVLVHLRTSIPFARANTINVEVQKSGEKRSDVELVRSKEDGGEIGSFAVAPADEDVLDEIVTLFFEPRLNGGAVGAFEREMGRFIDRETRHVFVCLADRCLTETACAEGFACGLTSCEPKELPDYNAPLPSWEYCRANDRVEPDDMDVFPTSLVEFEAKKVGGDDVQTATDIAIDPTNGSVIVAGSFQVNLVLGESNVTDGLGQDGFVARLSNQGSVEWIYFLRGAGDQKVSALHLDPDGTVYIGATVSGSYTVVLGSHSESGTAEGTDILVSRVSRDGTVEKTARFGSPDDDTLTDLAFAAGTVIVIGNSDGVFAREESCNWAVPSDRPTNGALFFGLDGESLDCTFGVVAGGGTSRATSISTSGSDFWATGVFETSLSLPIAGREGALSAPSGAGEESFLLRIGQLGTIDRAVVLGGAGDDEIRKVATGSPRILLAGKFGPGDRTLSEMGAGTRTLPSSGQIFGVILDEITGDHVLEATAGTIESIDGVWRGKDAVLTGSFDGTVTLGEATLSGNSDIFLVRVNNEGTVLEAIQQEGTDEAEPVALENDPSMESVIIGGVFQGQILLGDTTLQADGQDVFVSRIELKDPISTDY